MAGTTLSTHVLDTAKGTPASGLAVTLYRVGDEATPVARGVTDADGRIRDLGASLEPGSYRLVFDLTGYYGAGAYFEQVALQLRIGSGHHHVPLLVSPFGCVSYRGS